jgi:hypothetical protein
VLSFPAGQSKQAEACGKLYRPPLQIAHDDAPTLDWYLPVSQLVQLAHAAYPSGVGAAVGAPRAKKVFDRAKKDATGALVGGGVGAGRVPVYLPAGQSPQFTAVRDGWNRPGTHARQLAEPGWSW